MITAKIGDLAYFDSFAGLVPCKVISQRINGDLDIKITATRGAYKRGEWATWPATRIAPRPAVRVSSGQYRIRPYTWVQ